MNAVMVANEISRLPEKAQREVIEFVDFLAIRYRSRARETRKRGTPSMAPFVGMWRDRADMTDSTAWVREQRRAGWGGNA